MKRKKLDDQTTVSVNMSVRNRMMLQKAAKGVGLSLAAYIRHAAMEKANGTSVAIPTYMRVSSD